MAQTGSSNNIGRHVHVNTQIIDVETDVAWQPSGGGSSILVDPNIAWQAERAYVEGNRISVQAEGETDVWVYEAVIAGTSGSNFVWNAD
jgi:hypothetical protein